MIHQYDFESPLAEGWMHGVEANCGEVFNNVRSVPLRDVQLRSVCQACRAVTNVRQSADGVVFIEVAPSLASKVLLNWCNT